MRTVEAMKQGREVEYGFLGVLPEPLALDKRTSGAGGVRVSNVVPGTPAERSGLPNRRCDHLRGSKPDKNGRIADACGRT